MLMRMIFALVLALASPALAQDYTLEGPDSVGIRGAFDVTWTTPDGEGGILEIRPDPDSRRVGYGYARQSPTTLEAPEAPGDYVVVFFVDRELRGTFPLRVEMVSASVEGPGQADAGAAVPVTWTGPVNRSDYVSLAEPDGAPIKGASYAYVGNSKDGTVSLRAPQDAGSYDIVYITGKTVLARDPLSVGSIAASLTVPAQVPAGGSFAVPFDGPDNSGDIITFATRDGDRISPASYVYTGNTRDGVAMLRAFEEPGPYDVVYLSGGRIIGRAPVEVVEVSMTLDAPASVTALQRFEATWDGDGNTGDQVYLVPPGESSSQIYTYVVPTEPTLSLAAPETTGDYELVYITRGGRELARRGITVDPAPQAPGMIEVVQGPAFGPGDAVEVILDASGSMLQRQGGERRIEIAKRVLSDLVTDTIPAGTGFALRVFGNREADACRTDLEIPLAPHAPDTAAGLIAGITAVNLARTPIARSIALSESDLAAATGRRVLVLLTDGEETCDGDPAEAIAALRSAGTDVRVNIVGYAIDDAALQRDFESWAALGGGAYFSAADGDALGAALRRATAAPFTIRDTAGQLVGAGLAGDPPIPLPAGDYVVELAGVPQDATVTSDEVTRIGAE